MRSSFAWVLLALTWSRVGSVRAQQADSVRDTIPETGVSAVEPEAEPPRRSLVKWNEYEGPLFTLRVGAGFLLDYASYAQDDASREQMDLESGLKIRDSRLVISGRIKTKRRITYQAGIMYDGNLEEWFIRQTGLMIAVPEAWGNFWIGRTKEGPSLNRVMTGYDGWTAERFTFSDAAIPLLADGIKWLGYLPDRHLIWNVGVFTDWLSEGQTFSYYDHQVAGRVAWVPMVSDSAGKLVHIGASFQIGQPDKDSLRLKSKPEASDAPNFIDTGKFPATSATLLGFEAYYRPGPWLFGTEYYWERANSPATGDPVFHGGDIFANWLVTGETRSYNTV
ncbi:MAG TPA: porin, partial [Gemmatimonadales bacterium]|nr:porin [Gemmatimonadales bacterium]